MQSWIVMDLNTEVGLAVMQAPYTKLIGVLIVYGYVAEGRSVHLSSPIPVPVTRIQPRRFRAMNDSVAR